MKKKMKIRELKSKIKIIREIRGGAEGDKEIEGLTEGELPFSESEVDRAAGIINLPSNSGGSGRGGQVVDRPSEQPPRGEEAGGDNRERLESEGGGSGERFCHGTES